MEPKLNVCRNCGKSWIYLFDGDVPIDNYKNLGWRVNCYCGLATVSSVWSHNKEQVISDWNRCVFSTPLNKEDKGNEV